ncbi:hypothetical protein [Pedobacter rhodius]|uniref:Uncharacterized protein n=1 Tax=Pedobacter rhodius TaxID=3004098 RepID=A0ABT4L1R8_9SPHI|nr:hypothetical protein [Pedobacter sp. SJ11]MCZ4225123.1 hypothetical protein [Pedobacter sp. SJ11]
MKDPKEKDEKAETQNSRDISPEDNTNEASNWGKHQRVDEEGNELDPNDIK